MDNESKASVKQCTECKTGKLQPDEVQFSVDRGDKIMLISNVPAMVCATCLHKEFDKSIADKLTSQTNALFSKSSGRMFGYSYSDFIRDETKRTPFKKFDRVEIKTGVNTWDLYDQRLLPGMEGTIIGAGFNPFDYIVEFTIQRGRLKGKTIRVEIDEQDLELVKNLTTAATR